MGKFLAKSNGLELNIHSQIVSETALQLFNKISNEEIINRYKGIVMFSSLLHDIGKLTINFQKFLKNDIKKPTLKFRHNEIGWAFLSKYLKYKSKYLNLSSKNKVKSTLDKSSSNSQGNLYQKFEKLPESVISGGTVNNWLLKISNNCRAR